MGGKAEKSGNTDFLHLIRISEIAVQHCVGLEMTPLHTLQGTKGLSNLTN